MRSSLTSPAPASDAPNTERRPLLPRGERPAGETMVWLTSMGLAVGLMLTFWLLGFIFWKGLSVFWPDEVIQVRLTADSPAALGADPILAGVRTQERTRLTPDGDPIAEWQLYVGNRSAYRVSFRYVDVPHILEVTRPFEILQAERREGGDAFFFPVSLTTGEGAVLDASAPAFRAALDEALRTPGASLAYRLPSGESRTAPVEDFLRLWAPNQLNLLERTQHFFGAFWRFLSESPREANTEGGIFPAIFGTFLMTVLMSAAVMPFGLLAAIYLHEYARQGPFVQAVRIAVNNLAGVPSIVFGVFGLGFFVYGLGGTIDSLFFADRPAAVFGTGGIFWASLTLALLTVPVVIVASEEALASVPRGVREASMACGASRWQTIQRIVLPAAAPGILTGLILAMARGAGEVAPLMLVGVVKLAPALPLDTEFPFLHLERKFMHLGFHIYDLGFQSPDSEAARPMVFATTFLLIMLVLVLNLGAIIIRNHLRRRYATGTF